MKNKAYTFKKKRTNADMLEHVMIIIFLIIISAFSFRFYMSIDLIKNINNIPQLSLDSLFFSLVTLFTIYFFKYMYLLLSKPWYYFRFNYRLNTLFEQLAKNQTVSKKIVFPKVEVFHDEEKDIFTFEFFWSGTATNGFEHDVTHRISSVLFPNEDYFLEEPIKKQVSTIFKYCRQPRRLNINLQKINNDTIYQRKIRLNSNLFWDLDKQPHATVTGGTGSGKTMMLYYLIYEAAKLNSDIYIVDAKRADLSTLHSVKKIAETTDEIFSLFNKLINEMDARFEVIQNSNEPQKNATEFGFNDVFVFIDELAVVVEIAKTTDTDNKALNKLHAKEKDWKKLAEDNYNKIISSIRLLIFKSRQVNIHIVLATQNFEASLLGSGSVRDNLSMRILLGNASTVQVNQMGLTQEQLPLFDTSQIGSGIIWMDSMNWINARSFETPYLSFHNLRPNDVLENYYQIGKKHANS